MRTETELKQTWCPMARNLAVVNVGDVPITAAGVNRGEQSGVGDVMSLCIGLACSQCVDCGPVVESINVPMADTMASEQDSRPKGNGWKFEGTFGAGKRPTTVRWIRETGERHVYCGQNAGEALRQETWRSDEGEL